MANAKEYLDGIIDASNTLLKLLDASNMTAEALPAASSDHAPENTDTAKELLKLMAKREQLIHQLFENFSPEELQIQRESIQTMALLDSQLVEKVNHSQQSAKAKILTLKKNRKAINLYQKL